MLLPGIKQEPSLKLLHPAAADMTKSALALTVFAPGQ